VLSIDGTTVNLREIRLNWAKVSCWKCVARKKKMIRGKVESLDEAIGVKIASEERSGCDAERIQKGRWTRDTTAGECPDPISKQNISFFSTEAREVRPSTAASHSNLFTKFTRISELDL
jgi:hypothetical protein